jgi:hypothetical protein
MYYGTSFCSHPDIATTHPVIVMTGFWISVIATSHPVSAMTSFWISIGENTKFLLLRVNDLSRSVDKRRTLSGELDDHT